jgi:N-acetylmuramoyl-L-alanine amidase
MPKEHTVKQGECLSTIANRHGLFPDTIWNDSANAELKDKRKDPNVLYPGDVIVVPDKRPKEESCQAGKRHRFRRMGVPERFTLTLAEGGQRRANERYVLVVNGQIREGKTGSDGTISEPIPPNAREGLLFIGDDEEEVLIRFGHVDPITEVSGVQSRLQNLGFYDGEVNGDLSPETTAAIAEFQRAHDLPGNGELSDETRQELLKAHGS